MALYDPSAQHRTREWRRFVRVRARIKSTDEWRDASILNVSSHGLMVSSTCCVDPGGTVEIRSGAQALRARVVWRKGDRIGLRSESALPIMDIVSLSAAAGETGESCPPRPSDRRCQRRPDALAGPVWPRLLERGSTLLIAAVVAAGLVSITAAKLRPALSQIMPVLHR
jgi:hypothetical protein